MKCSDCRLWKTEDCRNNPDAKNLNYAETFACFNLDPDDESRKEKAKEASMGEEGVSTSKQVDAINYEEEAQKARGRALTALTIGLILIPIAAIFVFEAGGSALGGPDGWSTAIAFAVIAGIAGFASLILLLVALVFGSRHVELKGHIKNPVRKEAGKPKYPGF